MQKRATNKKKTRSLHKSETKVITRRRAFSLLALKSVMYLRATIFPISKTKVLRSNSARFSFFANISVYLLFVIVWNCNYYLQRRKIENLDNAWEIGARLLQTTSLSLNLDFFKRIFIELLTLWPSFDALFVN